MRLIGLTTRNDPGW